MDADCVCLINQSAGIAGWQRCVANPLNDILLKVRRDAFAEGKHLPKFDKSR